MCVRSSQGSSLDTFPAVWQALLHEIISWFDDFFSRSVAKEG
ncbi:MAG: hypothetical protein KatS3mg110_4117 [Pirellulaceae bacterium]|nr:MAG: hypothetical protein KatS3mg110_4117 [Pirellulaceae bacterium]